MLKQAFAPLIDLIYPPRCPLCGHAIADQDGLCTTCWSELVIPGEPACASCQRPFGEGERDAATLCAPCLATPPAHNGITAATLYNDASRKLVLGFKHGRKIALARMLARQMAARLPEFVNAEQDNPWLVIPVPLHRWRLWQRGYNQSALLARQIAQLRDLPLIVDGLVRHKATPPLGGLGRKERARMLAGAISANPARQDQLEGANVLLVDDVMTSGATTNACIKALRQAGAGQVRITCFARVLDEAL